MKGTTMNNHRHHLDRLAGDTSTPKSLRSSIDRHLAIWDRATALHKTARHELDRMLADYKSARDHEPARLLALAGKGSIPVDTIGTDLIVLDADIEVAKTRLTYAKRAADLAERRAQSGPFLDAIDEVLPWITRHRLDTPWSEPLPEHLNYAWDQSASNYIWSTPTLHRRYRFIRLEVRRPHLGMRRVWEAIGTSDIVTVERTYEHHRYRVVGIWPDLIDEE